jgi:flagellar biogenesis protein FliO
MGLLLAATQPAPEGSPIGPELAGLVQVLLALAAVSALAYGVLRALARRGFGGQGSGSLRIEQRIFLDAQSALLVVQVEGRRLLLATHRGAPARLITELEGNPPMSSEPDPQPTVSGPSA